MQVYIVKTLWRNRDDFNCDLKVFKKESKAQEYLAKERQQLLEDFDVTEENLDGNEYVSGDYDYFSVCIKNMEVE